MSPSRGTRRTRSVVGVFGVAGRSVDQPYSAIAVVDGVADTPTAGNLVLPLFQIDAIVAVRAKVPAQTVLAVVAATRSGVGAEGLEAASGIGQREAAQLLPAACGVTGAEANIPLFDGRGNSDPVAALGAHAVASTGPKSPPVGASAAA